MTEDALPYGDMPDTSFASQYKRIFEAADCCTQAQLAAVLEVRRSSISDALRRKIVPRTWPEKLLQKKGVNPEWIRSGTGPKYLAPASPADAVPPVIGIADLRPLAACPAQELFNELVRRALQSLDFEARQDESAPRARVKKRKRDA